MSGDCYELHIVVKDTVFPTPPCSLQDTLTTAEEHLYMSSKQVEKIAESTLQLRSNDPHTNQVLEVVEQKVEVVKGFLDKERARLKSVLQTMAQQQLHDDAKSVTSPSQVSEDKIKKLRMKAKRAKVFRFLCQNIFLTPRPPLPLLGVKVEICSSIVV